MDLKTSAAHRATEAICRYVEPLGGCRRPADCQDDRVSPFVAAGGEGLCRDSLSAEAVKRFVGQVLEAVHHHALNHGTRTSCDVNAEG
jgi:hypothetical protein